MSTDLNADTPTDVTIFQDHAAATKEERTLPLHALCDLITNTTAPQKAALPLLKMAQFGNTLTDRGSLRHNSNVVAILGLEADYDDERISFDEACGVLLRVGVVAIVYTSPSYTPTAPRWRVLCPLSAPYPPSRRDRFMARLNGLFGGVLAAESWVLSQSYYFGSVANNPFHRVQLVLGTPIDLMVTFDDIAIARPEKPKPSVNGQHGPATHPADVTDARIAGLVASLLDRVRGAADGSKHATLRDVGLTVGGYLRLTGWTEAEAVEQLVGALPLTVEDWDAARSTAAWAVGEGQRRPLTLEDRPHSRGNGTLLPQDHHPHQPNGTDAPFQPNDALEAGADPSFNDWSPPVEPPTIIVRAGERHLAVDAGLAALANAGAPLYQRGADLMRVLRIKLKTAAGDEALVPAVVPITLPMLARALGQSAQWRKYNQKRELIPIDPPTAVAEQILGIGDAWPFPQLRGVIATQTMRHDGTLLTEPGYDPTTGLVLFQPPPMPPIPDAPTKSDALEALALINSLLAEFSFAADDNVSRSAALSAIMTAVLRGAMPVAPMHVTTKPEAGTGGSYLQDLIAAIAIGKRCPALSMSANDEENEKRLAGAMLAQQPIIAMDNVTTLLMGDLLCQIIERPEVLCRRLGGSDMTTIANSVTVLANGNNLTIAADVVRRVIQIVLDADLESPETRTFTYDPVASVLADRGHFVAAVLTIARAYGVAGMPGRLPPRPSFERWSDIVRSPLVWLGWPDPVRSVERVRAEDPIRAARAAVFSAWVRELQVNVGYYTRELIAAAEERGGSELVRPALWDALFALAAPKSGYQTIDPLKFNHWLRKNTDVIAAGHKLLVDRSDQARPRYKLVPREPDQSSVG